METYVVHTDIRFGYAEINYEPDDIDIETILSTAVDTGFVGNVTGYDRFTILIHSFLCNVLYDTKKICLYLQQFNTWNIDRYCMWTKKWRCKLMYRMGKCKINLFGVSMSHNNCFLRIKKIKVLILQLENNKDDLNISKIKFGIDEIPNDKYIIKRYLGYNILLIFMCDNATCLQDLKTIDEWCKDVKYSKCYENMNKDDCKISIFDDTNEKIKYNKKMTYIT
jgi:hypothetical protein